MKPADIQKLREIIDKQTRSTAETMLYKDAFAVGCLLHLNGEKVAGRKLCFGVLDSLGFKGHSGYFNQILDTLDGNERSYAVDIWAHSELNELFKPGFPSSDS